MQQKAITTVSPQELHNFLSAAELVSEVDTHVNHTIRLLRYRGGLLLQEVSLDGEILVRSMTSREKAESFIEKRLDAYERMWDGCGCKINFRE